MYKKIKSILKRAEVDRAVLFMFLTKIWILFAGPISVLLIVLKFSPELQGYYYTFLNLISLQVFVELGFGYVIIQFASHEWSHLHMGPNGEIKGDEKHLMKLASLARLAFRWYLIAGIITAIVLVAGGFIFFANSSPPSIDWLAPWLTLSGLTGIAVFLVFIWSILEGCNQVAAFYAFRFYQTLFSNFTVWFAILCGAALWVPVTSAFITLVCGFVFLLVRYRNFLRSLFSLKLITHDISWKKEVLPMQWKFALSGIAGYFVFSIFTPVLFCFHGPVVAGQFGMAYALAGAVSAVSYSWIQPRVPQFGMLIEKRQYEELDRLFKKLLKIVVVLSIVLSALAWIFVLFLNMVHFKLVDRLLPPLPLGILFIAQIIMLISLPFSSYLRAHKKEPLLLLSVAQAVLTGSAALILGKLYSAIGIAIGCLCVNMIITPFIIILWQRLRKQWHAKEHVTADIIAAGDYI